MICAKCGQQLAEGKRFCSHCGAPAPAPLARVEPFPTVHERAPGGSAAEFPSIAPSRSYRAAVSIFLASLAVMCLSFLLKNRPPDSKEILEPLLRSPVQTPTVQPSFQVRSGNSVYDVTPKFDYDIAALVVSFHNSDSWLDISHKRWGDFVNIKDLCLLWGGNVRDNLHRKFRFRNYDWYCEYRTKDDEAFAIFRSRYFSNNHILAANAQIARAIMNTRRGDQIHMRGTLVDYGISGRPQRATSVTRDDTENGSCEIIYVTEFQILKRANVLWNALYTASLWVSVLAFVAAGYYFIR